MLNLANWLRSRSPNGRKAAKLYGSIVTQSRSPEFYSDLGISDTPNGRYEVLVLHMAIALHRLSKIEASDGRLSRAITEAFVTDIDDSLREMAVGDMAVPRRVKKAAAGLMERSTAYRSALEDNNAEVLETTVTSFFPDLEAQDIVQLSSYIRAAANPETKAGPDKTLAEGVMIYPSILSQQTVRSNQEIP